MGGPFFFNDRIGFVFRPRAVQGIRKSQADSTRSIMGRIIHVVTPQRMLHFSSGFNDARKNDVVFGIIAQRRRFEGQALVGKLGQHRTTRLGLPPRCVKPRRIGHSNQWPRPQCQNSINGNNESIGQRSGYRHQEQCDHGSETFKAAVKRAQLQNNPSPKKASSVVVRDPSVVSSSFSPGDQPGGNGIGQDYRPIAQAQNKKPRHIGPRWPAKKCAGRRKEVFSAKNIVRIRERTERPRWKKARHAGSSAGKAWGTVTPARPPGKATFKRIKGAAHSIWAIRHRRCLSHPDARGSGRPTICLFGERSYSTSPLETCTSAPETSGPPEP